MKTTSSVGASKERGHDGAFRRTMYSVLLALTSITMTLWALCPVSKVRAAIGESAAGSIGRIPDRSIDERVAAIRQIVEARDSEREVDPQGESHRRVAWLNASDRSSVMDDWRNY